MTTFNLLPVSANNPNARRAQRALDELVVGYGSDVAIAQSISRWRDANDEYGYYDMVGDIRHQVLSNYNQIERRFRNRPDLDSNRAYNYFREAVTGSIMMYVLDYERTVHLATQRQNRRLRGIVDALQTEVQVGALALGLIRRFQSAFLDGSEADVDDVGEAILEFDE